MEDMDKQREADERFDALAAVVVIAVITAGLVYYLWNMPT